MSATEDAELAAAAEEAEADNASRSFIEVDGTDVDALIQGQKSKRTKSKTVGHISLLTKFLQRRNEHREPESINPSDLNNYLALFFKSVRKPDGSAYQPSSLKDMQGSVARHLKEKGYKHNIINDIDFQRSRSVLESKQTELKKKGAGNSCSSSSDR